MAVSVLSMLIAAIIASVCVKSQKVNLKSLQRPEAKYADALSIVSDYKNRHDLNTKWMLIAFAVESLVYSIFSTVIMNRFHLAMAGIKSVTSSGVVFFFAAVPIVFFLLWLLSLIIKLFGKLLCAIFASRKPINALHDFVLGKKADEDRVIAQQKREEEERVKAEKVKRDAEKARLQKERELAKLPSELARINALKNQMMEMYGGDFSKVVKYANTPDEMIATISLSWDKYKERYHETKGNIDYDVQYDMLKGVLGVLDALSSEHIAAKYFPERDAMDKEYAFVTSHISSDKREELNNARAKSTRSVSGSSDSYSSSSYVGSGYSAAPKRTLSPYVDWRTGEDLYESEGKFYRASGEEVSISWTSLPGYDD